MIKSLNSRYFSGLTVTGLKPELNAIIARIYGKVGSWEKTKSLVIENNHLQTRSLSTAIRLETELRQRLKHLNESQLKLLADGSSNERLAMTWVAVLKRIKLTTELTRDLLLEKLEGSDPVLRRSDMTDFYKSKEKQHPELKALSYSSHKKIQSTLLSMLREVGLLAGKVKTTGELGKLQRPNLSTRAMALLDNEIQLRSGFLIKPVKGLKRA